MLLLLLASPTLKPHTSLSSVELLTSLLQLFLCSEKLLDTSTPDLILANSPLEVIDLDLLTARNLGSFGGRVTGVDYIVGDDFVEDADGFWERIFVVAERVEELLDWCCLARASKCRGTRVHRLTF